MASSGASFTFCSSDWKELVVLQRPLDSNPSTEAQMVLPPPGEWFLLTILTKDQSESWYHRIKSLAGGPREMIERPAPLKSHKATARRALATTRCDSSDTPGSPDLLTVICFIQSKKKALYWAREQIHHERQWWKPFQAGCQCASVLLWSTYLCFNISMSKTHMCTWILPDSFCPVLSSRLDTLTSGHFTVQLHFSVSGDKSR